MDISLSPDGRFSLATGGRCHLSIPVSAEGARAIASILRERQYTSHPQIGTAAFPTQSQVEKWLATEGRKRREEMEAERRVKLLEELGMDDADLAGMDIDI